MRTEARPLPVTYAALVFRGESLDPDLVTTIIEHSPSLEYRKGQQYVINNVSQFRRVGLWVYSTRNRVISDNLEKHLELIEEILVGKKHAGHDVRLLKIKDFIESRNFQFRVDIYWHGAEGSALPRVKKSFEQIVEIAGGIVERDFHRNGDVIEVA